MRRAVAAVPAVLAVAGATAPASDAALRAAPARLKVAVSPPSVHRGQTYVITITGGYNRRRVDGTPHLYVFIQYTGLNCRSTATAEYALPSSEWSWVAFPAPAQTRTPFQRRFHQQAGTRYGTRRVCAYLYAGEISPQTPTKPLARAGTTFQNRRK